MLNVEATEAMVSVRERRATTGSQTGGKGKTPGSYYKKRIGLWGWLVSKVCAVQV